MKHQRNVILIVDDDENDRFLLERALKDAGPDVTVRTAQDGIEALAYLDGNDQFADRKRFPFPTFIFVDLKMPRMDGFAVIQHVKKHPKWAIIPALVFSGSSDLDDIKKAFLAGAAAYHVKPASPEERKKLCRLLLDYWARSEAPQTDEYGKLLKTQSAGKLGEHIAGS